MMVLTHRGMDRGMDRDRDRDMSRGMGMGSMCIHKSTGRGTSISRDMGVTITDT
jgi:hypothetical protein